MKDVANGYISRKTTDYPANRLQRVAHVLDPKYSGELLSDEEVSEVDEEITAIASRTEATTAQLSTK